MQLHPSYPIRTARLRLRPLVATDLDALLAYRSDPQVCRYLPFEPQTREGLAERLAGPMGVGELTGEGQYMTLGVESLEIDRAIGDVILMFHDEANGNGELGYVFHPEVSGFGYATEACSAVLGLGFDGLGLRRIVARLDARNTASARLALRLGMRQEAHFVQNEYFKGELTDEVVFAMLAEEWHLR